MADIEHLAKRVGTLLNLDSEEYTIAMTLIAVAAITAVSMPGGSRVAMEELRKDIDTIVKHAEESVKATC